MGMTPPFPSWASTEWCAVMKQAPIWTDSLIRNNNNATLTLTNSLKPNTNPPPPLPTSTLRPRSSRLATFPGG